MAPFHELAVAEVRRETPDAVSIAFRPPEELRGAFRFTPGQYLTLRTNVDGEELRRTYSICSAPGDPELRIAVKRIEGGRFSRFANDALKAGMKIDVLPPKGRFCLERCVRPENGMKAGGDYVAFAAGAGVTPILSIIRTVLETGPDSNVTFFYGNRGRDNVIFRDALEDLKDRFLDRLTLIHVLSREAQDVDLFHGRIDADRVRRFAEAGLFDPQNADAYLVCGPGRMIDEVAAALKELGAPEDRILFERFTPPDAIAVPKPAVAARPGAASDEVAVEAILDGTRLSFAMRPGDPNVIDAAARSGIDLPHSCKGGMCCTCRCRIVEGEAEMAVNYSMEPWEIEAGFTLACQSRPKTPRLVLDFDAV